MGQNSDKRYTLWNCKRQCARYDRLMLRELGKGRGRRDDALIREYIALRDLYAEAARELARERRAVVVFRMQRVAFACCVILALTIALSGVAQLGGVRVWTAVIEGDIRYLNPSYTGRGSFITNITPAPTTAPQETNAPSPTPAPYLPDIEGADAAARQGLYFPQYLWTESALSLRRVVDAKENEITYFTGEYEGEFGSCRITVARADIAIDSEGMEIIRHDGETGYYRTENGMVTMLRMHGGVYYEIVFPESMMKLSALPLQTFMTLDVQDARVVYGD